MIKWLINWADVGKQKEIPESLPCVLWDAALIPLTRFAWKVVLVGNRALVGEGNGNPLQYSCLENPVDRGAWWAAVHGVTQSRTWLKWLYMHACIGKGNGNPLQCSCLETPRDRRAWWAAIYRVTQSRTRLKRLSSSSRTLILYPSTPPPKYTYCDDLWSIKKQNNSK